MIRPPPSSTFFPPTPLSRSARPAEKSVAIVTQLGALGQLCQFFHIATAENDIISDERFFEMRDRARDRSEEHTSELQSQSNLVCRLLLEKKKKQNPQPACALRHPNRFHFTLLRSCRLATRE